MDKRLKEKMEQKISETFENIDEIKQIVKSLNTLSDNTNSFGFGVVIGRLYNSFYYQSRRMLKRDPTKEEFLEFLDILKQRQQEFRKKL
jgi:preprotein translocase subunit Sss1